MRKPWTNLRLTASKSHLPNTRKAGRPRGCPARRRQWRILRDPEGTPFPQRHHRSLARRQTRPQCRHGSRGFIGIAFRLQGDRYEYIYLRPTNGRAPDQVRRNHSTQYGSRPGYDFDRMRKEPPEKYESYVDPRTRRLDPLQDRHRWDESAALRPRSREAVPHRGRHETGRLGEGAVALWVGPGTEGYFADLKITP